MRLSLYTSNIITFDLEVVKKGTRNDPFIIINSNCFLFQTVFGIHYISTESTGRIELSILFL